ncbi:hypothetical protein MBO10_005185, partial [Klebsiella pneumoniae]
HMLTIGWPTAIVFIMGYYWPVSLFLAISLIACSFTFTKKTTWRILGATLAVVIMIPAFFLWWISLTV